MSAGQGGSVSWYRVPAVWLLVALPLSAVIGGFITLWLAVRSDDGLVVDDYYRHGIEINRDLDRDRAAAARDIKARLQLDERRRQIHIDLNMPGARQPDQLLVQLLYATRKGYDRKFVAARGADGAYSAPLTGLVPGHYYVELAAGNWRLVGSFRFPDEARVEIVPVAGLAPR